MVRASGKTNSPDATLANSLAGIFAFRRPLAPVSHAASPPVEDTSQIPLPHASSKSLTLNGSGPLTSIACPATSAHFKSLVAHSQIGDQSPDWATASAASSNEQASLSKSAAKREKSPLYFSFAGYPLHTRSPRGSVGPIDRCIRARDGEDHFA